MKFKLIIVITQDELTDRAIEAARSKGATGATVIPSARGEGLTPAKGFLGLTVSGQRDLVLFLVEAHLARDIVEAVGAACAFDTSPGAGMAVQIDIEDAVGLSGQIASIEQDISREDL